MTKFTPLIDGNNKTVLQWTMTTSSGEEVVKSVPRSLWKIESAWSEQEIHDFFSVSVTTEKQQDAVVEEVHAPEELETQEELEDRIEELTEELEEIKEHIEKKTFLEN